MKKTVFVYGTIAGVVVSIFMATSILLTANNGTVPTGASSMIIGYLGMLISFAFIFVAIKSYRDGQNDGVVSFKKAFSIGLLITLIASTLYVITWAIVYHNFLPDYMNAYTATVIEEARASMSGAALQAKIDEVNRAREMYRTPWGFALFTYAKILPVGILVSLIAALVLKRREPKAALAG